MSKNYERDEFRSKVFKRDNNRCVVPGCYHFPSDAHHLIERRLWSKEENEGYIMDNCVSICEEHHKDAELSFIPPQALRDWAGIHNVVIPQRFDPTKIYNKWGIEIPKAPIRVAIKYPHTPYFSFSPSADEKDVRKSGFIDIRFLAGKPLVITTKMDGSNVSLDRDHLLSRGGHLPSHKSFDMLKSLHANIRNDIPENEQVFCEWLYAKHSIHYVDDMSLPEYCMVFAIYNREKQMWMEWDYVRNIARDLDLAMVPEQRWLKMDDVGKLVKTIVEYGQGTIKRGHEGIVVRSQYPFHYSQFGENVGKYVRGNHVQTDEHWMYQPIVKNTIRRRLNDYCI